MKIWVVSDEEENKIFAFDSSIAAYRFVKNQIQVSGLDEIETDMLIGELVTNYQDDEDMFMTKNYYIVSTELITSNQ